MFSIVQASTYVNDGLKMNLIISNKTKNDIFLKPELDNYVLFNKALTVHHTLTRHNNNQHGKRAGLTGRITCKRREEVGLQIHPSTDSLVCVCGPQSCENAMMEIMEGEGWRLNTNLFFF